MYPAKRNQAWIPSIFGDLFDDFAVIPAKQFASPAVNIKETDKDFQIEIAAPGMTREDFTIRVDNDEELVIALEKKHENKEEQKDGNYLRREFSYTSYHQAFTLPDNIDVEAIKATMTNGVLGIVLPKKTPDKQIPASRHIAIE
ncbi:MAG: Hsp20/alpha crystallin family protein [Bacteroidales bacterium]|nr:Hsp20/alpha crystallin family protein [Bacteroidales bacterium]